MNNPQLPGGLYTLPYPLEMPWRVLTELVYPTIKGHRGEPEGARNRTKSIVRAKVEQALPATTRIFFWVKLRYGDL